MIVTPLTFTEEILLLLLGEQDGVFLPVNSSAFECALASATLMDLAFALRIDTVLHVAHRPQRKPDRHRDAGPHSGDDRRPPQSDGRAA